MDIEVPLPTGKVWTFAPIGNAKARRKLLQQSADFADGVIDPASTKWHGHARLLYEAGYPISRLKGLDPVDRSFAFQLHTRSRRPKLTIVQAFELANAPEMFAFLEAFLDGADKSYTTVLRATMREELAGKIRDDPEYGRRLAIRARIFPGRSDDDLDPGESAQLDELAAYASLEDERLKATISGMPEDVYALAYLIIETRPPI